MRGRHFGFLATLCSFWIAARVGFLSVLPAVAVPPKSAGISKPQDAKAQAFSSAALAAEWTPQPNLQQHVPAVPAIRAKTKRAASMANTSRDQPFTGPATRPAPAAPQSISLTPWISAKQPLPVSRRRSGFNIYAYSFFRSGSGASGPIGGGQYGGSQSGVIATYTLARFRDAGGQSKLALLARSAIAHDDPAERELAAGLRWQPLPRAPFTLTAERRFRNARSDAFAVYLAGGKSADLPLKFRLDAFAQAGAVSGKDGGPFFDINTRAERNLTAIGKAPVTLGAGIWGGGQKGLFRIDAGPTIGTEVALGKARLRVNADWRFRIAGDARPASGPALTLSTSF
jgi:hypothetical protein